MSNHHSVKQCLNSEVNLDEVVPSKLAETWEDGFNGKDLRPKMTDGKNVTYLLDSGSMCCVWPAPAEAVEDKSVLLQSVDGSPFPCFGKKSLEIKLGSKTYHSLGKGQKPNFGVEFLPKIQTRFDLGSVRRSFPPRQKSSNSQKVNSCFHTSWGGPQTLGCPSQSVR